MSKAVVADSTATETSGDVPWDAVSDRLRRFISKRVDQSADVEDILQDTFVKIHVNLPCLKDRDKLTAWTYQIARNTIADFYRRQRDDTDLTDDVELVHDTTSAEASREIVSCLRPMVDGLDGYYRDAILLTEYDGLNQREMAERLGISISGAKSRVQRARAKLKAMMLECCHIDLDSRGSVIDYRPKGASCRLCTAVS